MNSEIEETEAFLRELEASLEDPELNGELDSFLEEVNENNLAIDEGAIFVVAHNGLSEDMQEIDALYIIESKPNDRAVHIRVTWEVKNPKEPKDIAVEYLVDANVFEKLRWDVSRKFRQNLADGDYCKRDTDMGLVRLRGNQYLHQCGGVAENLVGTLGRNAASIISFLEGDESYADTDLTYDNSWGSW